MRAGHLRLPGAAGETTGQWAEVKGHEARGDVRVLFQWFALAVVRVVGFGAWKMPGR